MIENIEPHKTGTILTDLNSLINGVVIKLNESIEKQNEIIDYLNEKEFIMEETERNEL